jgi:hypothetical protein
LAKLTRRDMPECAASSPKKPRVAVLRRGRGLRPAEKGDAAVAARSSVSRRHPPAFDVVDADHMDMGRGGVAPEGMHHRHARRRGTPRRSSAAASRRRRSRRRPNTAAAAHRFCGSVSSLRFTRSGRNPRSCRPRVNRSKTSRKIGLWKLLEISPISLVRPVVRLTRPARWGCSRAPARPSRPWARLDRHRRALGEGARHRRARHAGAFRHILQGHRHVRSPSTGPPSRLSIDTPRQVTHGSINFATGCK